MQTEQVDYGVNVGDQVIHIKGGDLGYVTELDVESDLGGVTTARVVWGASSFQDAKATLREDSDIQWTNKLIRVAVGPIDQAPEHNGEYSEENYGRKLGNTLPALRLPSRAG